MLLPDPASDTPEVLHQGQGGLLDVAVDPAYSKNGWIYLSYSHALKDTANSNRPPAMTRLVRGRLKNNAWTDQQVIYEAPARDLWHDPVPLRVPHRFRSGGLSLLPGGRPRDSPARAGPEPAGRQNTPHPTATAGFPMTTLSWRGKGPSPRYSALASATRRAWRFIRLPGLYGKVSTDPWGAMKSTSSGRGKNYGWPVITYGRNYNGTPVSAFERKPGLEQPVLFWRPSIAVCGIDFYRGDLFPRWKNRLLVGALAFEEVRLLTVENERVIYQETILKNAGRVRDVASGPDGAIYVVLNNPGTVLRLTPIVKDETGEF